MEVLAAMNQQRRELFAKARGEAGRLATSYNQDCGMWGHKNGYTVQLLVAHINQPHEWFVGTAHPDGTWTAPSDKEVEEIAERLDIESLKNAQPKEMAPSKTGNANDGDVVQGVDQQPTSDSNE